MKSRVRSLEKLECRYGTMLSFQDDSVIGKSLVLHGEWAEHELSCVRPYVRAGSVVVDVGANIGTHTLPFSHWIGAGRVIAVEAQPLVHAVLTVNCQLNRRTNIETVNAVCSSYPGWVQVIVDYDKQENIGAVSFASDKRRRWLPWWSTYPLWPPRGCNFVPVRRLDDIVAKEDICFVKLDVEGMELDVLRGARRLLRKQKPVIYMEQLSIADLPALYSLLTEFGYSPYWLETHAYNRNNFRGSAENPWWQTEAGILALPRHFPKRDDLRCVHLTDSAIPHVLDARQGVAVNAQAGC